jgi:DNA polymerase elongation subunit (family B)
LKIGDKIYSDCIAKSEVFDETFDYRLCKNLVEVMKECDCVITYYGTGFDIKFIRTRCDYWNIDFFAYGVLKHIDLYYQVKNKLKLHKNSLDAACALYGIKGKTHFDVSIWNLAKIGNRRCLDMVLNHNIGDVDILMQLYNKIRKYSKLSRRSI